MVIMMPVRMQAIDADGIFSLCDRVLKATQEEIRNNKRRMTTIVKRMKSSARRLCAKRRNKYNNICRKLPTRYRFLSFRIYTMPLSKIIRRIFATTFVCEKAKPKTSKTLFAACIENKPNKKFVLFICFVFGSLTIIAVEQK